MKTPQPKNRARFTAEFKRDTVSRLQASGLSQSTFCQQEGLKQATLSRWVRSMVGRMGPASFCRVAVRNASAEIGIDSGRKTVQPAHVIQVATPYQGFVVNLAAGATFSDVRNVLAAFKELYHVESSR